MKNVRVLLSPSHDIWFNLAIENWLFSTLPADSHLLLLYRNNDAIVMGRSQNPWLECDTRKIRQDKVKLARRQSGGGTVFHDLGNLCFSFMSSKAAYNKDNNFAIIINALKHFKVSAYKSLRNDLLIDHSGKIYKISGNAFREKQDRAFHHGTLLINTDLQRLSDYLYVDSDNITGKGVKSVRSSVINLQEINHHIDYPILCEVLAKEFFAFYGEEGQVELLAEDSLQGIIAIQEYVAMQQGWQWQYGKTFAFTQQWQQQFSWGEVTAIFSVDKGMIHDIHWHPQIPDLTLLAEQLIGCEYRAAAIMPLLNSENLTLTQHQWLGWLIKHL